MVLNIEEVLKRGLLKDPGNWGRKAQIGYDLTLENITKMSPDAHIGVMENDIPNYEEVPLTEMCLKEFTSTIFWVLHPGTYSLTFDQFCDLDNAHNARILNRSSIQRAGGMIISGVFDPGFASQIGATLFVHQRMRIEPHARVAQFVVFENFPSKLYDGQYQGNKDRK